MTTSADPLVRTADVHAVMAAIESVDLEAPWEAAAPRLRPALPRRRPLPPGTDDLPEREYPPGIRVTLGLDIGPAMLFVNHAQVDRWGVTADQAFRRALSNIRTLVRRRRQFALIHQRICGVPTVAFQSREGWASSLLLLPDELTRVLGARNGLLMAPMRDLLLLMPIDAEPGLAYLILEEFAEADMNALDLPLFVLLEGRLMPAIGIPADASPEQRTN
jgi:uncharacterized protein YtpQ (UPF0354 family)